MNNQLSSSLPAIQGAEITYRAIDEEKEKKKTPPFSAFLLNLQFLNFSKSSLV